MAEDLEQPSSDRRVGGRTPAAEAADDRQKEPPERRRSNSPMDADLCCCSCALIGIAATVAASLLAFKCLLTTCYKL
ncbi:Os08g0159300 [Oryza sativa Japonica Group]|jgi:hypothetical protein|uniref:Uncharacterized protein n=6 Tax=Oryza TaxID=4527 RepID=A3BPU8_ORYSJ|nr:hypothetical protein OsJ_26121 [Oryza sativa Japonica Group]BAC65020.1 hypothetical protein [Oryza sativa Japonica Group]BAT03921.1 Os08g0159300 [Oryza sativa Japonica Group]